MTNKPPARRKQAPLLSESLGQTFAASRGSTSDVNDVNLLSSSAAYQVAMSPLMRIADAVALAVLDLLHGYPDYDLKNPDHRAHPCCHTTWTPASGDIELAFYPINEAGSVDPVLRGRLRDFMEDLFLVSAPSLSIKVPDRARGAVFLRSTNPFAFTHTLMNFILDQGISTRDFCGIPRPTLDENAWLSVEGAANSKTPKKIFSSAQEQRLYYPVWKQRLLDCHESLALEKMRLPGNRVRALLNLPAGRPHLSEPDALLAGNFPHYTRKVLDLSILELEARIYRDLGLPLPDEEKYRGFALS